jgi:hypothetical protein
MAAPDFSEPTKRLLAQRSAMICNHPGCSTVTIGPDDADASLSLKIGEAAHIRAARKDEARFDEHMTDEERAAESNGIWLCASCHTLVDKNGGAGFPATTLIEWKSRHATFIASLLRTHRSPLAVLRRHSEEGVVAQRLMDTLENHGALFRDMQYENFDHVADSVKALRTEVIALSRSVTIDASLKRVLRNVAKLCQDAMNTTSAHPSAWQHELPRFRFHIGVQAKTLRDDHGCTPGPGIGSIIPH